MKDFSKFICVHWTVIFSLCVSCFAQAPLTLSINAATTLHQVHPHLFGIFFEEINHAGDGGLYAELVETRSFHGSVAPWTTVQEGGATSTISFDPSQPLNNASMGSLKIVATNYNSRTNLAGVANPGYWGILVEAGSYSFSLFAKANVGFEGTLMISLESTNGSIVYATVTTARLTTSWTKFQAHLTVPTGRHDPNGHLVIRLSSQGTVWIDMVSLFPPQTFKNRANGLRTDLADLVVDMKPTFVRFPGGCFIEGGTLKTAFLWKNTIGPIENRPGHAGFWGYWSTDGLGFLEYLLLCEDLEAEPVFVVNVGIAMDEYASESQLGPWIQDALDAVEYANGGTNTYWGNIRAQNGHPAPFNMKYLALGNENGCNFDKFKIYPRYYNLFASKIRAVYPSLILIANCDISSTTANVDAFDYHVYSDPAWFLSNVGIFDKQNRSGPLVFASEYAVTTNCGNGNLNASLAEAAWITGLIRNSDIVALASYAPLFVNVNNRAWNPDAIQFNDSFAFGTPSYHVQVMFASLTGDALIRSTLSSTNTNYASVVTKDTKQNKLYIVLVNYSGAPQQVNIQISGSNVRNQGNVHILTSKSLADENTLAAPALVSPKIQTLTGVASAFSYTMPLYSLSILEVFLA